MISEADRAIEQESLPENSEDKYVEYQEIDLFRRILAGLLQAPKSGSAAEIVERFRTLILDDAVVLKRAQAFERVEATMSAAALFKHVLECDDCKAQLDVCAKIEEMKTYISMDFSPVEPVAQAGIALGMYAAQKSFIPNQRDSHNN